MSIPLDANERSHFTPASLANMPEAPVFVFRHPTERDARNFWKRCRVEGLALHDEATLRGSIKAELRNLWDEESFALHMPRVEDHWNKIDHNAKNPDDPVMIDEGEQKELLDLMERLFDASPTLRRMQADNVTFMEDAPKMAIGQFLVSWKNIAAPMRKEAGVIPLHCVDELQKALLKLEQQAKADGVEGVEPSLAFAELALHAFSLLNLTETEAGNSASPSVSLSPPNSLSQEPSPQTAGGSFRKSGRSKKIRAGA